MGSQVFLLPAVSGREQGTPWTSCQLIAGPSLMPEATMQGYGQLHIRSNLGFSVLLKDTSTCSSAQPGVGI